MWHWYLPKIIAAVLLLWMREKHHSVCKENPAFHFIEWYKPKFMVQLSLGLVGQLSVYWYNSSIDLFVYMSLRSISMPVRNTFVKLLHVIQLSALMCLMTDGTCVYLAWPHGNITIWQGISAMYILENKNKIEAPTTITALKANHTKEI